MGFKLADFYSGFTDKDRAYGLAGPRAEFLKDRIMIKVWTGAIKAPFPTLDSYQLTKEINNTPELKDELKKFLAAMKDHKKYHRYYDALKSAPKQGVEKSLQLASHEENSILRAKSKFGIEWTLNNGGHVHFILNGLNMSDVTGKTYKTDSPKGPSDEHTVQKERSITGSELRWIYRNKGVPLVQKRVQFWLKSSGSWSQCLPPWELDCMMDTASEGNAQACTWSSSWRKYIPRSNDTFAPNN